MELIIKRIIDTLNSDLQDWLTEIENIYQTQDIDLYKEKIDLPFPNEIIFGSAMPVINDYPAIEIIGIGYETLEKGTVARPTLLVEEHEVELRVYFKIATSELPDKITKGIYRYIRAIERCLKENPSLADPISKIGQFAHSFDIIGVTYQEPLRQNDIFYRRADIRILYKTSNYFDKILLP